MTNSSNIGSSDEKKIKSFLYLDTEKMYSISSQIFEGLTEYVLNSTNNSTEESVTQKGREWGSGQILADIIEESSSKTEKRFLHDYSYNLFEHKLIDSGRVISLNESNIENEISEIDNKSFVKITGKVVFNDINRVLNTLENFNDFGYAIWYVTRGKELVEQYKSIKNNNKAITDRNKKAVANHKLDNIVNFDQQLREDGLRLDPDYLKELSYLLTYGYKGQFEVQIPFISNEQYYLFSAQLKREMLKENEDLIIRKYSAETEKKFTVFGIATQTNSEEKLKAHREIEGANVKQTLVNMVSTLGEVENHFTGKLEYEYVVDPIAMYIEI